MVAPLNPPIRPLPQGGDTRLWHPRAPGEAWTWCRVYHQGTHSPTGVSTRPFGPLFRFDHHRPNPAGTADIDPDRTVLYVGADFITSACEVFGSAPVAQICPNWRVAYITPTRTLRFFNLLDGGSAMAIGAIAHAGNGDHPRSLTQQWATAIYEDQPTGHQLDGIAYLSGHNAKEAFVLWDIDGNLDIVSEAGRQQDFALIEFPVITPLTDELNKRHITVERIKATSCTNCQH